MPSSRDKPDPSSIQQVSPCCSIAAGRGLSGAATVQAQLTSLPNPLATFPPMQSLPAGFVYTYSALRWLTNGGNIWLGQCLFAVLYLLTQASA